MKLLVVEDTEDARILLEDQLQIRGYEVESAVNGVEALEKVRRSRPDLIISDILMPQMDGFELCRQLKADPLLQNIPFIFYTATYTDSRDEAFALSLGANRFVIKPEEPAKLMGIIEDLLSEIMAGELVTTTPTTPEAELEHMHVEALSRKLDKKVSELERQKNHLCLISDAMPVLMLDIGADHCYRYVNKTHAEWFGVSQQETINRPVAEVMGEAAYAVLRPHLNRAFAGEPLSFDAVLPVPDQGERDIQAQLVPYYADNDQCIGAFALISDVTEHKANEQERLQLHEQMQQAQKMEAIGHLAGGIAHDFNNILAAIQGYTSLALLLDTDNSKLSGYLHQVEKGGERAQELIAQLLSFSRKSISSKHVLSPDAIVKEVIELISLTLPKTIALTTHFEKCIPGIYADPVKMHQVLMNLCVNARDAIDGHGEIFIDLAAQHAAGIRCNSCHQDFTGDYVVLSVKDTGTGINAEDMVHIFDLLFTTKEVGKGTGMGLAVIHDIVHEHGGHIVVESQPGVGTNFQLFFPQSKSAEHSKLENQDSEHTSILCDEGHHILVVDDEESIASFLYELLQMKGYRVTTFNDSKEALSEFLQSPEKYDLVVTDQMMPTMTGLEMATEMLKKRPELPVILCTGYSQDLDEMSVYQLGIKGFFLKPTESASLLTKIYSLVHEQ